MQMPVHVIRSDVTGGTDMRTRLARQYSPAPARVSTDCPGKNPQNSQAGIRAPLLQQLVSTKPVRTENRRQNVLAGRVDHPAHKKAKGRTLFRDFALSSDVSKIRLGFQVTTRFNFGMVRSCWPFDRAALPSVLGRPARASLIRSVCIQFPECEIPSPALFGLILSALFFRKIALPLIWILALIAQSATARNTFCRWK